MSAQPRPARTAIPPGWESTTDRVDRWVDLLDEAVAMLERVLSEIKEREPADDSADRS